MTAINFIKGESGGDEPRPQRREEPKMKQGVIEPSRPPFFSRLFRRRSPSPAAPDRTVSAPPAHQAPSPVAPPPVVPPSPVSRPMGSPVSGVGNGSSFIDVNLVPADVWSQEEPRRRLRLLAVAVGIAIVIVGGGWFGLGAYQDRIQHRAEEVSTQVASVESTIAGRREVQRAAIAVRERTTLIQGLFDNHTYWTRFYSLLETYTVADVYFTSFAGDTSGKLTLSAVGRDFGSVARQYVTFQGAADFATDVSITGATAVLNDDGSIAQVGFSVSLTLRSDVFSK